MLNMFQIMMNEFHAKLQTWGSVQYSIRLYNLARFNISTVNPVHLEIA